MTVIGVPGWAIRSAGLDSFLAEFTERGRFTVEDIKDDIATSERQCWTVVDDTGAVVAVALTKLTGGRVRTCHITHLTGAGLSEWRDAFNEIEAWARHENCTRIEAIARPGYERIGKRYGLRKTHVLLEKDLI